MRHLAKFCLLLSTCALCAQPVNLWPNGDFEANGNSQDAHTGTRSLQAVMATPAYYREFSTRKLTVEPFAVYKATAFIKSTVPKGDGFALVSYGWDSFGWHFDHRVWLPRDQKTWKEITTTICVPDSTVSFTPLVLSNAEKATAVIDDLSIVMIQSGADHVKAMLAKANPDNTERGLLARYFISQGDLAAAAKLQAGGSKQVKADIACLLAKNTQDAAYRRQCIIDMLALDGLSWPDGKHRLTEFFRTMPLAEQLDICRAAVTANPKSVHPAKAYQYLQAAPAQHTLPVRTQLESCNALLAALKAQPTDQLPQNARDVLAKFTATQEKQQKALMDKIKNLGNATIAIDGQAVTPASYAIVLPAEPTPTEVTAAEELRSHLELITGKLFDIVSETTNDARRPLIIGNAKAALAKYGFAIDFAKLGVDGLHIESRAGALALAGNKRGVLYAVYTFLEDNLGCRWFAADCSTTPTSGDFKFDKLNVTTIPALEYRDTDYPAARPVAFCVRNKMVGTHVPNDPKYGGNITYRGFVHTFNSLVPPETYGATHPEYYSEIAGKRVTERSQLCLTNPDVLRIATQTVRSWIEAAKPNTVIVSVSQNDWHNYCTCKKCTELAEYEGSQAGPLLHFVNAIATEICKDYPDQIIDTLAYQYTRKPPKHVKPHPNVAVRLCSIECCFVHPLETCPYNQTFVDDIREWSKICKRLHIWDYVINYAHCIMPFPDLNVLQPNIDFFVRNGVTGIYEEANYFSKGGELSELRSYLMAKALWNPRTDTQKNITEFCNAYYGAAAPQILTYIKNLHAMVCGKTNEHVRIYTSPADYLNDEAFISQSLSLFQQARNIVKDDPVLKHRVDVAMLPIIYTKITLAGALYDRAADKLTPKGYTDLNLFKLFEDTVKSEGITHYREGQGGLVAGWLEQHRTSNDPIAIQTLENDFIKVEIIPQLGGRIWSATHKASGRELFQVIGNTKRGYSPAECGFEIYPSDSYRGVGWNIPYTVTAKTSDSITLTGKLAEGKTLTRTIKLVPGKAAFELSNSMVAPVATKNLTIRLHPAFSVTSTANAKLQFKSVDGQERVFDLADPQKPTAEKELWFRDAAMPAGEWSFTDAKSGLTVVNTFPANQVKICYCNWNGRDSRVNLEQWSATGELPANTPVVLTGTYEIR